jgi:probable F420-dependent oxidoreductase
MSPIEFAIISEQAGFESAFLGEHPIMPVATQGEYVLGGKIPRSYRLFPDPFIYLGAMSAVTKSIRLGTAVSLVPEHHPILMAKEIATLDLVSRGRLILGAGAGWLAEASEIMGVDFTRRWPKTIEHLRAMKALWTGDSASFNGEFVRFPPVFSYPKPFQKPHPPILIGAGSGGRNNLPALRRVVAVGDGWMPVFLTPTQLREDLDRLKALCAESGREFASLDITMPLKGKQHLDETDPAEFRDLLGRYEEAGLGRVILTMLTPEQDPVLLPETGKRLLERLADFAGI